MNQISEFHIGMMHTSELVGRHQICSPTILKTFITADVHLWVQFVAPYNPYLCLGLMKLKLKKKMIEKCVTLLKSSISAHF